MQPSVGPFPAEPPPVPVRIGMIVAFVLQDGPNRGEERAALVVRVLAAQEGQVNLIVFKDGINDGPRIPLARKSAGDWETMVRHSSTLKAPGTWHYFA